MMLFLFIEKTVNFVLMNIKELNKKKVPIFKINTDLEKYVKLPVFQTKLDEANETLKRVGVPKPLDANG